MWHSHYKNRIPRAENLCGSFWWRDVLKFGGMVFVRHRKGNTFLLWLDHCIMDGVSRPLCVRFLKLFPRLKIRIFKRTMHLKVVTRRICSSCPRSKLLITSYRSFTWLCRLTLCLIRRISGIFAGEKYTTARFYKRIHLHMAVDTHCVLCPFQAHEDRIHLFF
jgi:hypothetical protein